MALIPPVARMSMSFDARSTEPALHRPLMVAVPPALPWMPCAVICPALRSSPAAARN